MTAAPNPPYVGPAAHTSAGSNHPPVKRIVIHGTVSPCVPGGARGVAAYFRSPGSGGSAHYVVDPGETVQVVYDRVIAWHAPPNSNSIGIELCDPQSGDGARWQDANHVSMLARAAILVAELAAAYDVPLVKIGPADLLAGKHGVCGHVDVSRAWHQSDHVDPGDAFPWASFMRHVHAAASGTTVDTPPPPEHESHGGDSQKQTPAVKAATAELRELRARRPGHFSWLTPTIRKLAGKE